MGALAGQSLFFEEHFLLAESKKKEQLAFRNEKFCLGKANDPLFLQLKYRYDCAALCGLFRYCYGRTASLQFSGR